MPPKANQAKTKKVKTKTETKKKNKPRVPRGPYGMKLKQTRYHQFTHNVSIYHFQASFISISTFRSLLKRQEHGYVSTLFSPDPLANKPVMDGDEMPVECMEVGYLRDVFVAGGSALGFRVGNNTVEWMCFDHDIKPSILDKVDVHNSVYPMLFEHVGDTERPAAGKGRKVQFTEHRDWYECLKGAERKPFTLSITWRKYGTEMQMEHLRLRREHEREEMGLDGDVDGAEEEEEDHEDAEEEYENASEAHRDDWSADSHGSRRYEHQQADYDGEEAEGEAESQSLGHAPNSSTNHNNTISFNHPNIAHTIEKHVPFIYRDPELSQDQKNGTTPAQPPRSTHSRTSLSNSVLSETSGNIPRSQSAPSAELTKLMGEVYRSRAKSC
jgi:hypothetical protein